MTGEKPADVSRTEYGSCQASILTVQELQRESSLNIARGIDSSGVQGLYVAVKELPNRVTKEELRPFLEVSRTTAENSQI